MRASLNSLQAIPDGVVGWCDEELNGRLPGRWPVSGSVVQSTLERVDEQAWKRTRLVTCCGMLRSVMSLPRLPVPDITRTLDGYLRSVQPILLVDEHNGGPSFAVAYARQQALVKSFLNGPASRAQARLRALDKVSPHNWLDDNFWVKKTYLEWRAPLLLNSNWWLTFVNDSNIPPEVVTNRADGITPWQVRRAACLVHGILDFKHRIRSYVSSLFPLLSLTIGVSSQELYPDTTRIGTIMPSILTSAYIQPTRSVVKTFHVPNIQHLPCPSSFV